MREHVVHVVLDAFGFRGHCWSCGWYSDRWRNDHTMAWLDALVHKGSHDRTGAAA